MFETWNVNVLSDIYIQQPSNNPLYLLGLFSFHLLTYPSWNRIYIYRNTYRIPPTCIKQRHTNHTWPSRVPWPVKQWSSFSEWPVAALVTGSRRKTSPKKRCWNIDTLFWMKKCTFLLTFFLKHMGNGAVVFLMAFGLGNVAGEWAGPTKSQKDERIFKNKKHPFPFTTCGGKQIVHEPKISTWQNLRLFMYCQSNLFWSTSVPLVLGLPHVKASFWSFSSLASSLVASWKVVASQMCVETACKFSHILKIGKPNIFTP